MSKKIKKTKRGFFYESILVSYHVVERFRSRVLPNVINLGSITDEKIAKRLVNLFENKKYFGEDCREYLFPWLRNIRLDQDHDICYCPGNNGEHVGLIYIQTDKEVVLKTCFRAVCQTCQKHWCRHRKFFQEN